MLHVLIAYRSTKRALVSVDEDVMIARYWEKVGNNLLQLAEEFDSQLNKRNNAPLGDSMSEGHPVGVLNQVAQTTASPSLLLSYALLLPTLFALT